MNKIIALSCIGLIAAIYVYEYDGLSQIGNKAAEINEYFQQSEIEEAEKHKEDGVIFVDDQLYKRALVGGVDCIISAGEYDYYVAADCNWSDKEAFKEGAHNLTVFEGNNYRRVILSGVDCIVANGEYDSMIDVNCDWKGVN